MGEAAWWQAGVLAVGRISHDARHWSRATGAAATASTRTAATHTANRLNMARLYAMEPAIMLADAARCR